MQRLHVMVSACSWEFSCSAFCRDLYLLIKNIRIGTEVQCLLFKSVKCLEKADFSVQRKNCAAYQTD